MLFVNSPLRCSSRRRTKEPQPWKGPRLFYIYASPKNPRPIVSPGAPSGRPLGSVSHSACFLQLSKQQSPRRRSVLGAGSIPLHSLKLHSAKGAGRRGGHGLGERFFNIACHVERQVSFM